jgi:hypothetical protein
MVLREIARDAILASYSDDDGNFDAELVEGYSEQQSPVPKMLSRWYALAPPEPHPSRYELAK